MLKPCTVSTAPNGENVVANKMHLTMHKYSLVAKVKSVMHYFLGNRLTMFYKYHWSIKKEFMPTNFNVITRAPFTCTNPGYFNPD